MKQYYHLFNVLPYSSMLLELREGSIFICDVNKRFLERSKRRKEDLLGRRICEAFPENPEGGANNWEQLEASLKTCIKTGKGEVLEDFRIDLPNPATGRYEERYFRIENQPFPDAQGRLGCYVLHIAQEVTQQVLVEKRRLDLENELQEQRELGKIFLESNKDAAFSLDREGRFLSVSQEGLLRTGLSEAEMLEQSFLNFIEPYEHERLRKKFQRVLAGEKTTYEADYKLGEKPRRLFVTLFPMQEEGKVIGCYGLSRDITAQWQAEKLVRQQQLTLEQSERKHKTLVEKASDLICISDEEGRYTFVSESYKRILGYAPEYLLGRIAFELIHPEDLEWVQKEFAQIEKEPLVQISAYRFRNAEGHWRWLETIVTDLREDPLIKGIVLNTRDATVTVEHALELERVNESYRMAAKATEDLIYEWNLVTDEVQLKLDGDDAILGHAGEVMQRRDFWRSHLHPEDKEKVISQLERAIDDPNSTIVSSQYRFQRADGSYAHWMDRAYILRDANGRALRLIGARTDVSERVRQQEILALSNKRFSLAMKATNEMIWDWDLESNKISRSELFQNHYGYGKEELQNVRKDWLARISAEDRQRVTTSLYTALEDPKVTTWREEYFFPTKHGSMAFIRDRGYIVRDAQGNALRMVGAALDLTKTKRLLTKVEEQNKILRQVAWDQSHMVRAPLARILGLLYFAKTDDLQVMGRDEIMDQIESSANELDQVIRKIVQSTEERDGEMD